MIARFLLTVLFALVPGAILAPVAVAQGSDTIYDQAGVLSDSEEQRVQEAFDKAQEEAGQPLYAFLVPDTGVQAQQARRELLTREAREENIPQDAGIIVVAPKDGWALVAHIDGTSEDAVYGTMKPDFQRGDYAAGLMAGAVQIRGEPATPQNDPGTGGLPAGGALLFLAALGGVVLLLRNRRSRQRLEDERRAAQEEFANLTSRIDEFDEKERLVGGYLEAQRQLLDQETEGRVETLIQDARSAGFGREFNGAASLLTSDPTAARERTENGRRLLEGALEMLELAETTIGDYRAADDAIEGKLRTATEEIKSAEEAEEEARAAGVYVRLADLRPEYDRLVREAAERAARRDEFDPRRVVAAIDALTERARERQRALREEVAARASLPEERSSARNALARAQETLEEYSRVHAEEESRWGPAALEGAPSPEELSSSLREAAGRLERAGRAEASGRFAEARSSIEEATALCREAMQAPHALKAAVAEADRRRRAGEEKLRELEARLERAKANEYMIDPYQRQRLRDYEYQLQNARYGFFGSDWLTALLLFEALDHDYVFMDGAPGAGFGDWGSGDWSGGDWSGGDLGGGDYGGGDFGGGDF
jgi:uncharacterized membrane protein YgcG